MKKITLLFIFVLLSTLTASAYDAEIDGIYYNLDRTSKQATVTSYNNTDNLNGEARPSNRYTGSVAIPPTVMYDGVTYSVTSIGDYAFSGCSGLTSIEIPNSVTSIGSSAFSGCYFEKQRFINNSTLSENANNYWGANFVDSSGYVINNGVLIKYLGKETSIKIPNSVISIGNSAFYGCSGLTSIEIPSSVTSIGNYAFSGCSGLTSIEIPSSVTSIGNYAFSGCTGNLTINCNIPSASSYWYSAFSNSKFSSLKIGDGVDTIGDYAFYGCSSLTSVAIENSVKSIGNSAFYGCSGLTSIEIPSSVTSIGNYAFSGCTGLTSVEIPNSVKSIGEDAFYNCSGLTSVTIGNGVTSIGNYAFYGCSGLTSITIGNGVTSIGNYAFSGCTGNLTVNCNIPYASSYNGAFSNSKFSSLKIGDGVKTIGDNAFYGCSGLKSVTIGNSVTSIGNYAFYNCSGLTSVIIGNSVTSIGEYILSGCSGRTSVEIPNSVTSIGRYAFYNCSGLISIEIPNSVTSIGKYAFSGCYFEKQKFINNSTLSENANSYWGANIVDSRESGLVIKNGVLIEYLGKDTSITIPDSVTSIGSNAFYNCTDLTSVTIPNSVTSIGTSAFNGCSGLTSVTIGNSVTSIGGSSFSGCSGLTSVTIPNSVISIENYAFYNCSGLTEVTIGNSVKSIGNNAFSGCSSLTSIEIPNSVTSIGNSAFSGCYFEKQKFINNTTLSESANNYWGANIVESREGGFVIKNGVLIKYLGKETSITIPNSVISIGENVFQNYTDLTSVTIPNSVKTISSGAFDGCSKLVDVEIPDSLESIGARAFTQTCKLYVNRVTTSLLALWNAGFTTYEKNTLNTIAKSGVSSNYSSTQTTITISIYNRYEGFAYTCDNIPFDGNSVSFKDLCPERSYSHVFKMSLGNVVYTLANTSYSTRKIQPTINTVLKTASSLLVKCSYNKGDAIVRGTELRWNGNIVNGDSIWCTGLDPNTSYSATYSVKVDCGTYTATNTIVTMPLTLTTFQPKVISPGNAIVAAESNLDDAEVNVGFEWRRTDWTDDFTSNTGSAYLYEGRMEGYIRNLNVDKLWKVRPYYESKSGRRYYGEWVGLDPTNTSYFEPTVHTYAAIEVNGNTANVKGYVMRGSDNITSRGFKYWSQANSAKSMVSQLATVPSDAKIVESTGNIMTAELTDLDYETEYHYVAFVTTSEGETFYGEERTFITGESPQIPGTIKCATPIINYENGYLSFSCETEGVEYVYEVKCADAAKGYGDTVPLTATYNISVYAKKDGYDNSDVAAKDITVGGTVGIKGDVNEDGTVNGTDIQEVINIIVNAE